MDKRTLIQKLADKIGRKPTNVESHPATDDEHDSGPTAEPATEQAAEQAAYEPVRPPEAAEPEPSAEPPQPPEPESIGAAMGSVDPGAPAAERLGKSLADAIAVMDKSGRMLEAQAKRQQQLADAVSELDQVLQTQSNRIEQLRADLAGGPASTADLAAKLQDLVERVGAASLQTAEQSESLASLAATVEAIDNTITLAQQTVRNDIADLRKTALHNIAHMRRLVLFTALLAAGAIVAAFVSRLVM